MTTAPQIDQPRYIGPPFDQARVHDAMRVGVVTCRPQTPLRDVAQMMVNYGMHAIVVQEVEDRSRPWGIVSTLDIAAAAATDLTELTAGSAATTDVVTVPADEPLEKAAKLMSAHGVTHLVVVEPATGWPCGVLSASGLAAVLAAPR
jgi:CBS domain-containing protein